MLNILCMWNNAGMIDIYIFNRTMLLSELCVLCEEKCCLVVWFVLVGLVYYIKCTNSNMYYTIPLHIFTCTYIGWVCIVKYIIFYIVHKRVERQNIYIYKNRIESNRRSRIFVVVENSLVGGKRSASCRGFGRIWRKYRGWFGVRGYFSAL